MPYRRLPNTDKKRIEVLKKLFEKTKNERPGSYPIDYALYSTAEKQLNRLEQIISHQKENSKQQTGIYKEYKNAYDKAKLYISHFIQVTNMAVLRGDLNKKVYNFFDEEILKVPVIKTEKQLCEIGEKIIAGEKQRIAHGGTPITNPTIALVSVRFNRFKELKNKYNRLQETSKQNTKTLETLRPEIDNTIKNIWNLIEAYFDKLPPGEKRKKCAQYGIWYVYRPKERKNEEMLHQIDL